jgi:hypothetical protein
MPRNSTGTYTAPSANFVSGTVINSSVTNEKFTDLGNEITSSLSRDGEGAMLAPLKVPDGTINLPGYTFDSETSLGLRRAGTADLRFCKDGTDLFRVNTSENRSYVGMKVSSGGLTVDAGGLTVTAGGLIVTAGGFTVVAGTTTIGAGINGLNGGALVVNNGLTINTGGATVVNNVPSGAGTTTTGNGTGAGLVATGGATGNGGTFTGGATSGAGVVATASAGNSNGITATGNGTGRGGQFTGGATGDGVRAVGGGGSASGIYATGGASGAGGFFEAGTAATPSEPTIAVELLNGHLKLTGAAPNADEALANILTPKNIPKAWAVISTNGSGSATVNYGFGIASVAINSTELRVTFASSFTPAPSAGEPTYFVQASCLTQDRAVSPLPSSFLANRVDLRAWTASTGGTVDLSSAALTIFLVAFGAQ